MNYRFSLKISLVKETAQIIKKHHNAMLKGEIAGKFDSILKH